MEQQTYTAAGTALERTLRFLAAPSDVNWGGKVHGGTVMRWIDEAAYVCAAGWNRGSAIAVYAGGIRFYRPLLIGSWWRCGHGWCTPAAAACTSRCTSAPATRRPASGSSPPTA